MEFFASGKFPPASHRFSATFFNRGPPYPVKPVLAVPDTAVPGLAGSCGPRYRSTRLSRFLRSPIPRYPVKPLLAAQVNEATGYHWNCDRSLRKWPITDHNTIKIRSYEFEGTNHFHQVLTTSFIDS